MKKLKQGTLCVQAGYKAKNGEPIELPIIQSTTFKYDDSDEMAKLFDLEKEGYFYTRLQNPTNDAVAAKIATLEGGVGAVLTSSGQAANFYAIFNICQAGDHFITNISFRSSPDQRINIRHGLLMDLIWRLCGERQAYSRNYIFAAVLKRTRSAVSIYYLLCDIKPKAAAACCPAP